MICSRKNNNMGFCYFQYVGPSPSLPRQEAEDWKRRRRKCSRIQRRGRPSPGALSNKEQICIFSLFLKQPNSIKKIWMLKEPFWYLFLLPLFLFLLPLPAIFLLCELETTFFILYFPRSPLLPPPFPKETPPLLPLSPPPPPPTTTGTTTTTTTTRPLTCRPCRTSRGWSGRRAWRVRGRRDFF